MPAVGLAVAVTLATPDELVVTLDDDRIALVPAAGTAKLIVTPLTGLLVASSTVT